MTPILFPKDMGLDGLEALSADDMLNAAGVLHGGLLVHPQADEPDRSSWRS